MELSKLALKLGRGESASSAKMAALIMSASGAPALMPCDVFVFTRYWFSTNCDTGWFLELYLDGVHSKQSRGWWCASRCGGRRGSARVPRVSRVSSVTCAVGGGGARGAERADVRPVRYRRRAPPRSPRRATQHTSHRTDTNTRLQNERPSPLYF